MIILDEKKIERAQNEKFKFKIEDYLRRSFSIYSSNWIQFSMFALVAGIISVFSAVTIVGPYLVYYPLLMGYCNVVDKIENEEAFEFKDFFVGFNQWSRFISLIAIMLCLAMAIFIPYLMTISSFGMMAEEGEVINTTYGILTLVFLPVYLFIFLILFVVTFLAPYLIYFGKDISGMESLRLSYLIAKKNFWTLLLFIILLSIICQFGFYFCLVGALVTIPLAQIMAYLFVKDFLLKSERELDIIVE